MGNYVSFFQQFAFENATDKHFVGNEDNKSVNSKSDIVFILKILSL